MGWTPLDGIDVPRWWCGGPPEGGVRGRGYHHRPGCGQARVPGAQGEDPGSGLPSTARGCLARLVETLRDLKHEVAELNGEIAARAKADGVARRLTTVPGIRPLIATAIEALAPSPETFPSGRDFAASVHRPHGNDGRGDLVESPEPAAGPQGRGAD
jgi:transposase